MRFEVFTQGISGAFAEFAVFCAEGSGEMTIDIKFTDYFSLYEDGDYDFRFCFQGAGQIARVGINVIDEDGLATRGGGSADALVEGNAGMRGHRAAEGTKDEHVGIAGQFQHVKADPVVAGELL